MEQIEFPQDFSEFLKLLNAHHVEYLLDRKTATISRIFTDQQIMFQKAAFRVPNIH